DSLYCHLHLHPTDLHSFPTRRSSDLPGKVLLGGRHAQPVGPDQLARYRRGQRTVSTGPPFSMAVPAARGNGRSSKRVRDNCPRRSEEHTSELQSRENLVCRLLLEKKK